MNLTHSQLTAMTLKAEQVRGASHVLVADYHGLRLAKVAKVTLSTVWVVDRLNKTGRAVLKGRVLAALNEAQAEAVRQALDSMRAEQEALRDQMNELRVRQQQLTDRRDQLALDVAGVTVPASTK